VAIQTTNDDISLVSPGLVKNVGPGFTEFINKEVQTEEDALRNIRQKEIDFCKASIAGEQAAQVLDPLRIQIMYFLALLWFLDILVRIRIRGSVPLTYGSGSFFVNYCSKVHIHQFSPWIIKFKRSHKIVKIKVFLTVVTCFADVRIRARSGAGSRQNNDGSGFVLAMLIRIQK
jgi:hypothetical protein